MRRFVILLVALLIATAGATNVKECKDKPFPLSVIVEGCDTLPCDVIKGTTQVMYVHFVNTQEDTSYDIQAKVRATALGITVPYDLPKEVADVCSNLMYSAFCPIYKTEDVVYKFNFYVDSSYPEISVKVEVSLKSEDNETLSCFVVDIKVKKGVVPNKELE